MELIYYNNYYYYYYYIDIRQLETRIINFKIQPRALEQPLSKLANLSFEPETMRYYNRIEISTFVGSNPLNNFLRWRRKIDVHRGRGEKQRRSFEQVLEDTSGKKKSDVSHSTSSSCHVTRPPLDTQPRN